MLIVLGKCRLEKEAVRQAGCNPAGILAIDTAILVVTMQLCRHFGH